jgi:hypothetical protein
MEGELLGEIGVSPTLTKEIHESAKQLGHGLSRTQLQSKLDQQVEIHVTRRQWWPRTLAAFSFDLIEIISREPMGGAHVLGTRVVSRLLRTCTPIAAHRLGEDHHPFLLPDAAERVMAGADWVRKRG